MAAGAYQGSLVKAIQSLDSLNDQIVQYIFLPQDITLDLDRELSSQEHETLRSSMLLIRRLLMDAQGKFRKMVEDNKQLAARIDGSIHLANEEVNALRSELASTNKRLTEITNESSSPKPNLLSLPFPENDTDSSQANQVVPANNLATKDFAYLIEKNQQLEAQVSQLMQQLEGARSAGKELEHVQNAGYGQLKLDVIQKSQDLMRAKEALQSLKADRKRLKADKLELLNQIKKLYGTLEEKENEIRDFLRNYQQQISENDENIKQLTSEKENVECEKWEIIKRAREAAERCVMLQSKLDSKEQIIQQMKQDLAMVKNQFSLSYKSQSNSSAPSDMFDNSKCLKGSQSVEELLSSEKISDKSIEDDTSKFSNNSLLSMMESTTPSLQGVLTSSQESNTASLQGILSSSQESNTPSLQGILSSSQENFENQMKNKRKKTLGSLSKIFSKGRTRHSIAVTSEADFEDPSSPSSQTSLLTNENLQEKLNIAEQLKDTDISQWKANQVLTWLEVVLTMPMYGKMCSRNIKSGKVLLGLSDSELASALSITSSMHRRKLRLAIEEKRNPNDVKFVKAVEMDHNWVCEKWLTDLGLSQYKATFELQLVDGRMLNTLTKKDLEKHFAIQRKFHHASILHGIELLRSFNFDKEKLESRRSKCEEENADPLVWTNDRVIKWIKSIDLSEYGDKLKETGVHGALIVMEPSFTAETLATALGIPPSKSYIRRHLSSELETLIKPARDELEVTVPRNKSSGGSLGRSFSRSFRSTSSIDDLTPKSRKSIRGSLGKAFNWKWKDSKTDIPGIIKQAGGEPKTSTPISHKPEGLETPNTTPVVNNQSGMDTLTANTQQKASPQDFSSTAV
ncbi:kazrin-like isoform X2 [Argonauta hians]